MKRGRSTAFPAPEAFALTSSADPDEIAEELEALATRTQLPHFVKLAKAARQPGPGQRSAERVDRARQRNDALRRLAAFYPGSRRRQCVDILALLRRYEEGAWRLHDSKLTAMPTRYGGTAFEEAFR
ncbi:hypothetical protein, partial [Mesorhizobium sp. M4B.F.Ca.ET.013.02.1.1]|uniref:hypothetical protein n=1 Tax=Mesorhizobium sp. M4B.F.Ca.ET.013.02.1.1 TaxID=2496755 RepID=UPI000FD595DA